EYIVQVLEDYTGGIRIVKLHGSLHEKVIPATFPDFFELRYEIRESVKRYLNQDLIIVGSIEHEHDLNYALIRHGKHCVYSVLPYVPTPHDSVVKLITARG